MESNLERLEREEYEIGEEQFHEYCKSFREFEVEEDEKNS